MTEVWCVKHSDGWCASKINRKMDEGSFSVETKCGYFIALPWGCEKRQPTCEECIECLN